MTDWEQEFKSYEGYGVFFSLLDDGYESTGLHNEDERISLEDTEEYKGAGDFRVGRQSVFLDGEFIGHTYEFVYHNFLKPSTVRFQINVPDEPSDEIRNHPNFVEDEFNRLQFATLKQLVDYRLSFSSYDAFEKAHGWKKE